MKVKSELADLQHRLNLYKIFCFRKMQKKKERSKTNNDLTSVPPLILWNNRQKNSVSVWGLKLHFSVVEYQSPFEQSPLPLSVCLFKNF